jgi:SAM-dependent methyltransferase
MGELRDGFDGVAELYDRIRPAYPAALFDDLFGCLPEQPHIVEVGPGTGQATRSLLAHGARVTAVERGPKLAEQLRRNFAHRSELRIVVAGFEEAPLAAHSFDAVVAATSFHWIDRAVQLAKPSTLLRPGGYLAVIDTVQVASEADHGFFERTDPVYARHGRGGESRPLVTPDAAESAILADLASSSLFDEPRLSRYRWDQTYSTASYCDLLRTYSDMQAMTEGGREALIADIAALIDRYFSGHVTRPLVITLTLARTVS